MESISREMSYKINVARNLTMLGVPLSGLMKFIKNAKQQPTSQDAILLEYAKTNDSFDIEMTLQKIAIKEGDNNINALKAQILHQKQMQPDELILEDIATIS